LVNETACLEAEQAVNCGARNIAEAVISVNPAIAFARARRRVSAAPADVRPDAMAIALYARV